MYTRRVEDKSKVNSKDRQVSTTRCLAGRVLISQKTTALVVTSYPNQSALAAALKWERARSGFVALGDAHS
jgi:hypothetical protein